MTGTWHFNELHPGDKTREPIQGEFFSTDAIQNPAEALVREGIQNSLDAKRNGELVRVRIYISGVEGSLPADKHNKYFEGSWEHFKAERNGLKDVPLPTENCPFLVYEDFGTTGLQGDIYQWHETTGVKNSFFYFFRAEGRSGKSELDRGRWGVGKYVFPRSSRVSSFLGVTARADDGKRLLMGQAVLKTHHVAEKHYSPDGYLGILSGNGLMLPIESSDFIKTSFQDFKLKRNTDPGLSIIVPWYDLDINDIMLAEAVIRGYFYSILAGELIVTIATPAKETILEKATLLATIETHYPQLGQELSSLIELTKWALSVRMSGVDVLNISPLEKAAEWRKDLIPDTLLLQMRQKLEAGDRIAVRVPVSVKEKGKEPKQSFFDVFLVRNGGDENERPFFIREGIIVSDIRSPRTRGIQSIVIADDKPLATFLGDSENPAHTQWQKDGSNFKGKYVHGPALLNFVIKSVTSIIQIMNEDRQ
ncbi:MAG TPA: hypothetical protein VLX29_01315, partial [Nitrospirota bacterium]|nr:hypothetical protein [Nitrospirota bacterium]